MRHFLLFMALVFSGLFLALFMKNERDPARETKPVVRVFASSSFIAQWGPGPWLRNQFEQTCNCRIEFLDGADSTILLQRLKSETRQGADVVLGLDQFDLEAAKAGFEWNKINTDGLNFEPEPQAAIHEGIFVPFDWGVMSFVFRKSELAQFPRRLEDLLRPEFKGQISMQDPRTSSAGLQFLLWLIQVKGEEEAFQFLRRFNPQVKAYSTGWSMAYGLFTKGQALSVWSYVTSPLYHRVEEKNLDIVATEFEEGLPLQFEYVGIPSNCQQCELAGQFVALVLSPEGQKVIMEKNYMFPVIRGVRPGTVFAEVPPFRTLAPGPVPGQAERERLLRKWSALRRME